MKKKYIKIVCILCMIWAFSLNANAQWRFGIEGGGGVHTAYHYDYNGFNTGKDNKGRTMYQANFVADYLLPRHWTPNWLTLSLRTGIGFMQIEDNSMFNPHNYIFISDENRTEAWERGVDLLFEVEAKYLISNKTRIYLNGGITPIFAYDGTDEYFDNDSYKEFTYKVGNIGYQFGIGIEIGSFRIGYKNFNMAKTITEEERGNRLKSAHCLSIGFWFNGSRFLKKHSSLNAF